MDNRLPQTGLNIATLLSEPYRAAGGIASAVPPIVQTSLFTFDDYAAFEARMSGQADSPIYTRVQNPTVSAFEDLMARAELAEEGIGFASGMAAISGTLLSLLSPGDRIACITHVYSDTFRLMETHLKPCGIQVSYHDPEAFESDPDLLKGVQLAYLESPGSMMMRTMDLARVAEHARRHGALTVIDNTWATPVLQTPIAHEIDVSLHSASKYIGGHSDTVAGVVCTSAEIAARICAHALTLFGGKLAPLEAFLLTRGLRTLSARIAQHQRAADLFVSRLSDRAEVRAVHAPGQSGTLKGRSGLMSVEFANTVNIPRFADALRLFRLGVSWGALKASFSPHAWGWRRLRNPIRCAISACRSSLSDSASGWRTLRISGRTSAQHLTQQQTEKTGKSTGGNPMKRIALPAAMTAVLMASGAYAETQLKLVEVITSPERTKVLQQLVDEYEAANEGVEVEIVSLPWGQAFEKLATMVAGGDIPDVVEMPERWLSLYAGADKLVNLEEHIAKWEHGETLSDKTMDMARYAGGEAHMLPYGFYLRAMFYNKKLLNEAGVEPPKTMDEFKQAAAAVSELDGKSGYCLRGGPGGLNAWVMMAAAMNGTNEFFTEDGQSRINEPGSVEGLQFLIDMYQDGNAPRDSVNWGFNEIVARLLFRHLRLPRSGSRRADRSIRADASGGFRGDTNAGRSFRQGIPDHGVRRLVDLQHDRA